MGDELLIGRQMAELCRYVWLFCITYCSFSGTRYQYHHSITPLPVPILSTPTILVSRGAWLSERLRRWSKKPDVVGSISVTTQFFLISCDSNQVPNWFETHNNLEVPY